jgi:hypothetical protein
MAFALDTFVTMRPWLYHLTSAETLVRVCELARLESASWLLAQANRRDLLRERRAKHTPISVSDREVWLRDQEPLHEGNIAFIDG